MLNRARAVLRMRRNDESGSIILAVGVIMVLTLLSVATLSRSMGNVVNVKRTQDFSAGLAAADSGLADALYQIDQKATATFTNTGPSGAGAWAYTATFVDENNWTVDSQGTVNGVKHAIRANVTRESVYPYAIFTQQDLTFHGNGGTNVTSYNSITDPNKLIDTNHAFIGSNHAITINGGGGGDQQDYFTPNGSCSGCPSGHQRAGPRATPEPTPPTPNRSCGSGTFTGNVDGGAGTAYICNQNVTFTGTVTVINPPLIVYVGANYALDIANADINNAPGAKGKDFILLKAGTGPLTVGNGSHVGSMTGVLYAPSSNMTVDGGQMGETGSVTLNQLTINGNPNFAMQYDDSILQITSGDWKVNDWREVPSH